MASTVFGCVPTNYSSHGSADSTVPFLTRQVRFDLKPEAFRDAPDCVTVLAAEGTDSGELAELVESAVTRHLKVLMPRVIPPRERIRLERELALDLQDESDRRTFAGIEGCGLFLRPRVTGGGETYLVVWSQQSIELSLELLRGADQEVLWHSSHRARRGDGGLPLSILSVGVTAVQAGRFIGDEDVMPSLVDDAVRRMFVTFPDLR